MNMTKQLLALLALAGCIFSVTGCRTKSEAARLRGNDIKTVIKDPAPEVETIDVETEEVEIKPIKTIEPTASVTQKPIFRLPVNENVVYTVVKNDTVSLIAYRYNLKIADIKALNPGMDINKIRIGQKIKLPKCDLKNPKPDPKPRSPKVVTSQTAPITRDALYTVKNGDTLGHIAYAHGVTVAVIKKANNLKSDNIRVNQKLKIPAGGVRDTPRTTTPKEGYIRTTPKPKTTPTAPTSEPKPVKIEQPVENTFSGGAVVDLTTEEENTFDLPPQIDDFDSSAVKFTTHTVAQGEDLISICTRYTVGITEIRALNGFDAQHEIKAGDIIKIPEAIK